MNGHHISRESTLSRFTPICSDYPKLTVPQRIRTDASSSSVTRRVLAEISTCFQMKFDDPLMIETDDPLDLRYY